MRENSNYTQLNDMWLCLNDWKGLTATVEGMEMIILKRTKVL